MRKRHITLRAALLGAAATIAWPLAAHAQDAAGADEEEIGLDDIEQIVVTARRREESAIDVPIAISAFEGDDLVDIGARDLTVLSELVPNVTIEVTRGTNTTLSAFIRGVGQQDPVAGFEGGVGIYIDDIYLNRPQAALLDIFDVERIEVLRGPQGTLYGRNTIGGAVKYVTRRLDDEAFFETRTTVGTFRQIDNVTTFGIPVLLDSAIGDLKVGGSIGYFRRDGFGDNLVLEGVENYQKDILAGRLTVEWDPTERLSVRFTGDWTDDNSDPRQGHRLLPFTQFDADGNVIADFPVLDNVFDTRSGLNNPEQSVVARGVSGVIEYEVNDYVTVKNVLGYRDDRSESPIDFDSLPIVDLDVPVIYDNEQFSEELQVLFNGLEFAGIEVNGLAGFYYLHADAFNAFDVLLTESLGAALAPFGLPVPNSFTLGDVQTDTWSIFGNFTADITDWFSFEFGARYTSDNREAVVQRAIFNGPSPFFGGEGPITPNPFLPGDTPEPTLFEDTFREFDPRVSLTFKPFALNPVAGVDDLSVYVSWSQGFKGGGFDPRCAATAAPDFDGDGEDIGATLLGAPLNNDFDDQFEFCGFDPETINTFEIGQNSSLFGGRLTSRVAFFYSLYDDVQVPGSIGIDADGDGQADNFAGVTTNAAEADLFGVEVDGNATLLVDTFQSGDALDYSFTLGYINAEFDEFIGATGEDISDLAVFQNTPAITAFSQLTYTTPMPLGPLEGDFDIFGSFSYRSEASQFNFEIPAIDQEGFVLFNAGFGWTSQSGQWSARVNARNILDKEYIVAAYDFVTNLPAFGNAPLGVSGVQTAFFGDPRTVTGTITFRY